MSGPLPTEVGCFARWTQGQGRKGDAHKLITLLLHVFCGALPLHILIVALEKCRNE